MFVKFLLSIFFILFLYACTDQRTESEKVQDRILIQFAKKMQSNQLSAIGMGGGCTIDEKINLISITFTYSEIMNIESARKLIVKSTNELLEIINSNQEFSQYFENYPISEKILLIAVIGADDVEQSNCISVAYISNGKIYYCADDPERKIMPYIHVHEETFEEAIRSISHASHECE